MATELTSKTAAEGATPPRQLSLLGLLLEMDGDRPPLRRLRGLGLF